jgi:hypothetical protein
MTSLHIDGDIFAVEAGGLIRFSGGRSDGWEGDPPGDTLLRETPRYTMIAGGPERHEGWLYAYDRANARIVAVDKASGEYRAQYRLAGGVSGWEDMRGFYIVPPAEADQPSTIVWVTRDSIQQAVLEAVPDVAPETPAPSEVASPQPDEEP